MKKFEQKEYRDAYVEEHVKTGLAYQITALREQRGWTQTELGDRMGGKPQSAISRLEDPNYGRYSLSTLLEVASAFDVALDVKFVTHRTFLERNKDVSKKSLEVASFDEDPVQRSTKVVSGKDLVQHSTPNSPSQAVVVACILGSQANVSEGSVRSTQRYLTGRGWGHPPVSITLTS